jgi:glycosyltransferase involved in cell wall biosynthesis
MKLCYIAAGVSTHTLRIANWMAAHGQEVSIISYTPFSQPFDSRIRKYELKKLGPMSAILNKPRRLWWHNPFLPLTMKRLMLQIQPDITETHYVGPTGMLLAKLANHHPHVMVCQGSDVLQWPNTPQRQWQLQAALHKADAILVMSEHMKGILNSFGIFPGMAPPLLVTNTGVDTEVFRPTVNRLKGECILSTRNLDPVYDVETLLKAMRIVHQSQPELDCYIVGDGSQRRKLEEYQDGRIRFLGRLPMKEMPRAYLSATLYVSTALSDGTSISLLEAMATDLPCVLTDIPANRPWVEPEYLFKPGDPADLARVILHALEHPPTPGMNRQKVIEKANFQTEMSRLLKLYEELKR